MNSIEFDSINNLNAIPDNEDCIIQYLINRLKAGKTYTWVGQILLSLNPQENHSPELRYSSKNAFTNINFLDSSQFFQKNIKPHIFAVVANAHFKLLNNLGRTSQVILISGDSGSGKTFNANQAINFLAAINKSSSTCLLNGKKGEKFVEKIVNSCPLITAFSTASTEKNSQSSRHGQLIRFQYEKGIISGASIQSFLLERTRVTRGNNNFIIFYQLLFGSSDSELENFGLSKDETYDLLGINPYDQNERLDQSLQKTLTAMRDFGFSEKEREEILNIIALLIHLGNVKFIETGDGSTAIDIENKVSRKALEKASILSAVSENELNELLTTTLISTQSQWRRHSTYRRNLGLIEICRNRLFSIIRHLYDNLFHWLIDRVNQILSTGDEYHNWLGILDIFGFESFAVNGLEELSINYANERLQLYFMRDYLESGHQELLEEGLSDLPTPRIIDVYRDRLNAIEVNLFTVLNDASQHSAQNNNFHLKNQFRNAENIFFKLSQNNETFIINHYSQPVEYSLQDLLSKNSDKVPNELGNIFSESSNSLLKFLSAMNENNFQNKDSKIYARKGTTLAKVKCSLDALLNELKKCDTNYVKCVKPRFIENSWDKIELKRQLVYTGILDALPLARCKFSIRLLYEEFLKRYSKRNCDWKNISSPIIDSTFHIQRCKEILKESSNMENESSMIFFGKRLIFLNESFFFKLEKLRNKYLNDCALKIQIFWKNYQLKKVAILNKESILIVDEREKSILHKLLSNNKNCTIGEKSKNTQKLNDSSRLELIDFTNSLHIKSNQYGQSHSTISLERNIFFYNNRIISRQRLAEVPIRFHTRLTCLSNSHCLPKSELPNGLEDCL